MRYDLKYGSLISPDGGVITLATPSRSMRATISSPLIVPASTQLGFRSASSPDIRRPLSSARNETMVGSPKMVPVCSWVGRSKSLPAHTAGSSCWERETWPWSTYGQNEYGRWSRPSRWERAAAHPPAVKATSATPPDNISRKLRDVRWGLAWDGGRPGLHRATAASNPIPANKANS